VALKLKLDPLADLTFSTAQPSGEQSSSLWVRLSRPTPPAPPLDIDYPEAPVGLAMDALLAPPAIGRHRQRGPAAPQ